MGSYKIRQDQTKICQDRTGSDVIRQDHTGSDKFRQDQTRPDRIRPAKDDLKMTSRRHRDDLFSATIHWLFMIVNLGLLIDNLEFLIDNSGLLVGKFRITHC